MSQIRETRAGSPTTVQMDAVVLRCGCDDPLSHASQGLPCPTPRATEDLGTVAYYHPNPLRRAWYKLMRWIDPAYRV